MDEEPQIEAPAAKIITLEHILCGLCFPETYLCGTPRPGSGEQVATSAPEEPCIVCFSIKYPTCSHCGRSIEVKHS